MQQKPLLNIGIDFDDVISITGKPLFEEVKKRLGISMHDFDKIGTYEWEKALGVKTDEIDQATRIITSRYSFHKRIPIIDGCKRTLKTLKKKGHNLFVISARETWSLPYSTIWLKYHGILPLLSRIIHQPSTWDDSASYKAKVARELKLDVFLEDAPDYALAIAYAGISVIVFETPYNMKTAFPKNVFRVRGWNDVLPIIGKIRDAKAKKRSIKAEDL